MVDKSKSQKRREWYKKNRDRVLALQKEAYLRNSDKKREQARLYRIRHLTEIKTRAKRWRQDNPWYKKRKREKSRELYEQNPEKILTRNRLWRSLHREEIIIRQRHKYQTERLDPQWRKHRNKIARRYEANHPDNSRKRWLKHKYDLTPEQFKGMLESQGGGCAICGDTNNASSKRHLDVDHDRQTGKVRGILCNNCNRAIGHFHEDIYRLNAAIRYLGRFSLPSM